MNTDNFCSMHTNNKMVLCITYLQEQVPVCIFIFFKSLAKLVFCGNETYVAKLPET